MHLGGLRNDQATEDSLETETGLNTLNTVKVAAAMTELDKKDKKEKQEKEILQTRTVVAEVIDEKVEYTQPAANPTSVTRSLNSIQEIKDE